MGKKKSFLMFIAASVSAFLGGFISNQLYSPAKAVANDSGKQQSIQPRQSKIPAEIKVVEANQFRLVSLEGNCLAKLTIEEVPKYVSIDKMLGITEAQKTSKTYHAVLEMGSGHTKVRMTENMVEFRAGNTRARLLSGSLNLNGKSHVRIDADDFETGGALIEISDEEAKTRAVLGRVDLNVVATGETQKRPESSLVLFGKDGKVVYSAP